jgi:hypothetical protein
MFLNSLSTHTRSGTRRERALKAAVDEKKAINCGRKPLSGLLADSSGRFRRERRESGLSERHRNNSLDLLTPRESSPNGRMCEPVNRARGGGRHKANERE